MIGQVCELGELDLLFQPIVLINLMNSFVFIKACIHMVFQKVRLACLVFYFFELPGSSVMFTSTTTSSNFIVGSAAHRILVTFYQLLKSDWR